MSSAHLKQIHLVARMLIDELPPSSTQRTLELADLWPHLDETLQEWFLHNPVSYHPIVIGSSTPAPFLIHQKQGSTVFVRSDGSGGISTKRTGQTKAQPKSK